MELSPPAEALQTLFELDNAGREEKTRQEAEKARIAAEEQRIAEITEYTHVLERKLTEIKKFCLYNENMDQTIGDDKDKLTTKNYPSPWATVKTSLVKEQSIHTQARLVASSTSRIRLDRRGDEEISTFRTDVIQIRFQSTDSPEHATEPEDAIKIIGSYWEFLGKFGLPEVKFATDELTESESNLDLLREVEAELINPIFSQRLNSTSVAS